MIDLDLEDLLFTGQGICDQGPRHCGTTGWEDFEAGSTTSRVLKCRAEGGRACQKIGASTMRCECGVPPVPPPEEAGSLWDRVKGWFRPKRVPVKQLEKLFHEPMPDDGACEKGRLEDQALCAMRNVGIAELLCCLEEVENIYNDCKDGRPRPIELDKLLPTRKLIKKACGEPPKK
jgi:hypothetical protein